MADNTSGISGGVESTAVFVAAARALEAQKPDPLAIDPYAEVLCRAAGGDWADLLEGRDPGHTLTSQEFGEHIVNFLGARTRYFDEYFHQVARAGVRQVVVLGAGLDSRAYRLPWPEGTRVFELDLPAVLSFKRTVLDGHGATAAADRYEIAVDLREDWPTALCDSGFRPDRTSAWIAEGLLNYLRATAQERLFTGIHALSAPGSHLALEERTPMDPEVFQAKAREAEDRRFDNHRGQWWDLVHYEQHAPAAQWFNDRGWSATATALTDYLQAVGRSTSSADSDTADMLGRVTLVTASKI